MICISGSTSKVIMNNQKIQMVVKMIKKNLTCGSTNSFTVFSDW